MFEFDVAPAGDALNVGFVKSTFAAFEVWLVVLQFPAASHTFTELFVHVAADHSPILQVTGVPDAIHANVSVYVNVEVCVLVYHPANVLLLLNAGAVLSNLIEFDVRFVVLQLLK
jgi:hypothetical protein